MHLQRGGPGVERRTRRLGRSQLGGSEEDDDEDDAGGDEDGEAAVTGYGGALFMMGIGALFLSLNVAPTEEMMLISYLMTPWHAVALIVLSLILMHAFVYAVSFEGQLPGSDGPVWGDFVRFTAVGYVLWVATVRPSKRPEMLLELARPMPQHRFVVIGGSDPGRRAAEYQESIRQAAAALPNVEFRGFVPFVEADRFFDGARVVINTSLYEGFPNTFLQAWSRGVPTVAFVDTGSRSDGQPVYDVVPDLDAMALKVARLMGDDIAWESASRRVAAHFRDNHSVEAIVGLYEREIAPWARSR